MSTQYENQIQETSLNHSYLEGFNGKIGHYRIKLLDEYKSSLENSHILEIGAGEGQVTEYLIHTSQKLTTIEPGKTYYNILKKKFEKKINLHNLIFEEFKTEEIYDNVVLFGVLEHVANPITFLKKIKGILKEDGNLFLTVPNALSCHRTLGVIRGKITDNYELSEQDHKVGHYRYYDLNTLTNDINSADFSILKKDGIILKSLPNSKMDLLKKDQVDFLFEVGRSTPEICSELFIHAKN